MAVDFNILKYFKSLHLLPRVIFFVGLVLLLGGGFSRIWEIPVGGIGIMFLGVGYNLAEDSFFHEFGPPYPLRISGANLSVHSLRSESRDLSFVLLFIVFITALFPVGFFPIPGQLTFTFDGLCSFLVTLLVLVFLPVLYALISLSNEGRCPECGGTLLLWGGVQTKRWSHGRGCALCDRREGSAFRNYS
jgi:hypothetical protein